jgi:glycosyltransferase involved in cell wall biosynthesis
MSYANLAVYDYSLLKHNKDVTILFFGNSSYDYKRIVAPTNFIPLFKYNEKKTSIGKAFSYIKSICRLISSVKKNKPKLIHIQWIKLWCIDFIFLLYLKISRINVIYTAHNLIPHESAKSARVRYKLYYKYVTKIIVHTKESKQKLVEYFSLPSDKINVIPHGTLDLCSDKVVAQTIKEKIRKYLKIENQIVFSLLGIQSPYKGSDLVVKLWAENPELHNENKYQLLFWGHNNKIDTSPIEYIKNVSIVNRHLTDEEFLAAMKLTSVLLMPYRTISQSGVLLTAINESIPYIISSAGSLRESLSLAKTGWYMGDASYENLRNCVFSIIENKEDILIIKNDSASWSLLQKVFAWDNIAKETFNIYNSLDSNMMN